MGKVDGQVELYTQRVNEGDRPDSTEKLAQESVERAAKNAEPSYSGI